MTNNYIPPKLKMAVINKSSFCHVTSNPTKNPNPGENEDIYEEIW